MDDTKIFLVYLKTILCKRVRKDLYSNFENSESQNSLPSTNNWQASDILQSWVFLWWLPLSSMLTLEWKRILGLMLVSIPTCSYVIIAKRNVVKKLVKTCLCQTFWFPGILFPWFICLKRALGCLAESSTDSWIGLLCSSKSWQVRLFLYEMLKRRSFLWFILSYIIFFFFFDQQPPVSIFCDLIDNI